jgi:hypothetical protein
MPRARERQRQEMDWTPVVGRALAFLCLHYAEMRSKPLLDQAKFLKRFGIPRAEAAGILGTTDASLAELDRQRRQRKATGRKATARRRKPPGKGVSSRGRKR